jgi:hypothetical protein
MASCYSYASQARVRNQGPVPQSLCHIWLRTLELCTLGIVLPALLHQSAAVAASSRYCFCRCRTPANAAARLVLTGDCSPGTPAACALTGLSYRKRTGLPASATAETKVHTVLQECSSECQKEHGDFYTPASKQQQPLQLAVGNPTTPCVRKSASPCMHNKLRTLHYSYA